MDIQIIRYEGDKGLFGSDIDVNTFNSPRSFDDYDLNIVDLSDERLWRCKGINLYIIDSIKDFKSIKTVVKGTNNAKVLYVLPQNIKVKYHFKSNQSDFSAQEELKNELEFFTSMMSEIIPCDQVYLQVVYERNTTLINDNKFESDFYFSSPLISDNETLSSSTSKKKTTVSLSEKLFITTCDITKSFDLVMDFINSIFSKQQIEDIPDWVREYDFYNDKELLIQKEEQNKILAETNERIAELQKKLDINDEYKSILFATGDSLSKTVFTILEIIFDIDLSTFKDICKQDFLFEKSGKIFVGEIKGVKYNVRYEYINQSVRHYAEYADGHSEISPDCIKPILIINPLRNIPVTKREKIMEDQIKFAKNNHCLIVETVVLLKLLEKVLKKELSTDDCVDILFNSDGALSQDSF